MKKLKFIEVSNKKFLHIANWYPNPWDNLEGNFVRDQIQVFAEEQAARVVAVQVRYASRFWPRLQRHALVGGAHGYFLLARVRPGRVAEWLSTLLLIAVLLRERAWKYDALHFHIAYPLLMHSSLWRWLIRKPIFISEHWSAYHYKFHLPEGSRALERMRRLFQHCKVVFAVSEALLNDIRCFSPNAAYRGFVLPNVVPLHGASSSERPVPVLFAVNQWMPIKNPLPMLAGLNEAALAGHEFKLVIGGFGPMMDSMMEFVETTALQKRTTFTGKLTKTQIGEQLAQTDGYLFSSDYETFSVACAEALGAGVPLIGPHLDAIAEYAGPEEWERVGNRDAEHWRRAIIQFLHRRAAAAFDRKAIAARAAKRFSSEALRARYCTALEETVFREESR